MSSVSIVPVGLTKFREGLEPLETFNSEECAEVIKTVDAVGDRCEEEYGTRIFYCSDEFYVTSKTPLPACEFYEEFEQIENGVGMLSSYIEEFDAAVDGFDVCEKKCKLSFVSGMILSTVLPDRFRKISEKLPGLEADLHFIKNDFFGEKITVTGLITGSDIISQLKGKPLGDILVLPNAMLRDYRFLDDISVSDVENALGVRAVSMPCDGLGSAETIRNLVINS